MLGLYSYHIALLRSMWALSAHGVRLWALSAHGAEHDVPKELTFSAHRVRLCMWALSAHRVRRALSDTMCRKSSHSLYMEHVSSFGTSCPSCNKALLQRLGTPCPSYNEALWIRLFNARLFYYWDNMALWILGMIWLSSFCCELFWDVCGLFWRTVSAFDMTTDCSLPKKSPDVICATEYVLCSVYEPCLMRKYCNVCDCICCNIHAYITKYVILICCNVCDGCVAICPRTSVNMWHCV